MKKTAILVSTILLSMGLMACAAPTTEVETPIETPQAGDVETPTAETGTESAETEGIVIPENNSPRAETAISQEDLKAIYSDNADMQKIASYFLGMKAPDFEMTSLAGNKVTLAESIKENTIVEFMASWCSVCESVKPAVDRYKGGEGKTNLISVSIFDESASLREFAGEDIDDYFEVADEDKVADDYLLNFVPIFFFVDSEGIIQFVYSGEVSVDTLNELAEKAFELK